MKLVSVDLVRAKRSRIAERIEKMEGNAIVHISERSAKPCTGIWKKVKELRKDGVFFVKTATLYGASEIWQYVGDSDKVELI
jgi:4-hydroxyphenylpyruvate dioxygenase-like putative hemolysin